MIDIAFTVPSPPVGMVKPRPIKNKHTGKIVGTVKHDGTVNFQAMAADKAEEAIAVRYGSLPTVDEPVTVDILAVHHRPQNRCRKKDTSGLIPATRKPDWDNIAKNVCDALRAVWRDDSIVCVGRVITAYAEREGRARVEVRVRSFEGDLDELWDSWMDDGPSRDAEPRKRVEQLELLAGGER